MKKISRAAALERLALRGVPVFMGGDGAAAAPAPAIPAPGQILRAATSAYPLAPPAPGPGTTITVETMLNEPTRITRQIEDITLEQFLADFLFTSAGGVTGGAVVYDMPMENDLYSDRDIQRVQPGAEFPILTSSVPTPRMAEPEKWGAKIFITDEARDRNQVFRWNIELRKMANTIVRKINQRAVEVISAIFTEFPGQIIPGNDWTAVTTLGTNPTAYTLQPIGDLVAIQLHNENLETGMEHDTLLINPQERARLQLIYGQEWRAVLGAYGYTNIYVSRRVVAGTAFSIASGQLGEMRIESPLATETWRDPNGRQITWVQSSVRPMFYVTNPFAIIQLTGLAG